MPASRKTIEQRQEAGTRATRMKKTSKKMDNGLSDQYEQDDYDTDELQNSQSNDEANPNEMENLNIGY